MEKTETNDKEFKMRLNIKRNFKGEIGYEYTVRADTIDELKALKEQVKLEAEVEVK